MAVIPLNRRFIVWNSKESADPELPSYFSPADGAGQGWATLLDKHRVVILAEAGSGKSAELEAQAQIASAEGKFAFHATVQNVGAVGLERAVAPGSVARLDAWKSSDQPAWFFLDSVDEAKARDVTLADALRELATSIHGAEGRARIVLSGRYSDWEFRRDLETLERWIPIPPPDLPVAEIDPNDLIIRTLRRKTPPAPPVVERPLVVVMAALDRARVKTFAVGKGVADVEEFCAALDDADLWDLARRPLDLDWLVRYWTRNRELGSLAEMLRLSIEERLREPDVQRARQDPVDGDRSLRAAERIGAALTLGRIHEIQVPDSSPSFDGAVGLDLQEVLPDWPPSEVLRLLSRPVFDPARFGHVRLHNDNQGAVRAFLCAGWISRLKAENCPRPEIHRLLFDVVHGVPVVKKSMRQTAAWLSISDSEIAREVVRRDPLLLMNAGDPASLPLPVREQVLEQVIQQAVSDRAFPMPDHDSLRRFSAPDMAEAVRRLWGSSSGSEQARELLLIIIGLGKLRDCADLAEGASLGRYADRYTQLFSGRALMATADAVAKRRYAEYIRDNSAVLPGVLLWDALESMFPNSLTVDDLIAMLLAGNFSGDSGGLKWDYHAPKLMQRIASTGDAQRLLEAVLNVPSAEPEPDSDDGFKPLVEAAGNRLLELSPATAVPPSAVEAAFVLGEERLYRRGRQEDHSIFTRLHQTPERRRVGMWAATAHLRSTRAITVTDPWQLEMHHYPTGLELADIDWLLEDAAGRQDENERRVAANAALTLWRRNNSDPGRLQRIQKVADANATVADVLAEWLRPVDPEREARRLEMEVRRQERRNAIASARADRSWIEFAERLRGDPDLLRRIPPPTPEGVNGMLYDIWRLVNAVGANQARYAVEDLSPLVPMLGADAVAAARDAFVAFWRHWTPRLHSERSADQRNVISTLDCIGILGTTQEAVSNPHWATQISGDEAKLATKYATVELNGFPRWLRELAAAHPAPVRDILMPEIEAELRDLTPDRWRDTLQRVADADVAIVSTVAEPVFNLLSEGGGWSASALGAALAIVRRAYQDHGRLKTLLRARFEEAGGPEVQALYGAALFHIDAQAAMGALVTKLATLDGAAQTALVQSLLPRLFGDRTEPHPLTPEDLPFDLHERLVKITFRTIRVEEDIQHPPGRAYSPGDRDHAEDGRNWLFKAFVERPGLATFEAIRRLMAEPHFPISEGRLRMMSRERAVTDAEAEPWRPADVPQFEDGFTTAPRTPLDLQRVAIGRIEDMQHELLHGDFAQGKVLAGLKSENDVQVWVAEQLRIRQGRSYTVERESHAVDEKEPDVRLRSRATSAILPIELKVAENWTLKDLEEALEVQLVGKYLRAHEARHGLLLLVHQESRPLGWHSDTGVLTFAQVVRRLQVRAHAIAASGPNAPQPLVVTIDVSSVAN